MSARTPVVVTTRVSLSGTTTGWQAVALPELGNIGKIRAVKARLDATDDASSAVDLYIVNATAAPAAVPDDLDVFWKETGIVLPTGAGSATAADLEDHLGDVGGAEYAVKTRRDLVAATSDLWLAGNFTASSTFELHVEVRAEVIRG